MKITFPLLLFLVFLVLKLTSVIDWSWWWVTAPLWLGFVASFLLAFIFEVIKAIIKDKRCRR